jgi:itaconyl-CoA hydratase
MTSLNRPLLASTPPLWHRKSRTQDGRTMTDFDATQFRTIPHGHSFEDFEPGRIFDHHWGRTLNEGDNSLFTTATLAYNPLYFNAEYARAGGHPDVVVNPFLVLCAVVGLSVEDLSEAGGPFLGIDELTFHRPVYPGDTLTARSEVISARESESRPIYGVVTWHTEGFNQHGEVVIDYKRSNLAVKRGHKAL